VVTNEVVSDFASEPLRKACAELERRLRAGEACQAEDILAAFPAIANHVNSALELIYTEFVIRQELGQRPSLEEYYQRFPQWQTDLAQVFVVHRFASADQTKDAMERLKPGFSGTGSGAAAEAAAGRGGLPRPLEGYEILEEIGRGGMGVVYRARQLGLNRIVALKMILAGDDTEPEDEARFRTEAEAAAALQHANIVQIYEIDIQNARPYFSMEYLEGGNLHQKLAEAPLPVRQAATLVATLAHAVQYAHERGIVHRDLKPGNILLTADGVPKITDFGLAKRLREAAGTRTRTGAILGTPSYMSPEQAEGRSANIGPAADIYALGAILYEILTGRPPFRTDSMLETLLQVRTEEPVSPRRLQPRLPGDIETICLKCLQKEPRKRYRDALALAEDLARFVAGRPIRARAVSRGEKLWRWCRRKPVVAGLLAALVLALLAGSAGVLWQWQRATSNAALAEQNAAGYARERDIARQEKERAERHLQMIRKRVEWLHRLGDDLLHRPGMYRTGQAVLQEALAFYQELLPEEGHDPRVRREAANLFRGVAWIHYHLDQAAKAAEAWSRAASLLTSLLEEEPGDKTLREALAHSQRWRGNALRELGKLREAREAYDQAAGLQEGLLRESPDEPARQVALANTLLNAASVLSPRGQAEEIEPLYRRSVELNRAAVRAAPDNPQFNFELALAMGDQGLFLLETGRRGQAEATLREALGIQQRLIVGGRLKGTIERYAARNFGGLGRVLAAAGKVEEAEKSYRQAVDLLDRRLVAESPQSPDSAYCRADLADTWAGLADILKDPARRQEVEEIRRRVIGYYEKLRADFPEDPEHRRNLALSYLQLVSLLWQLGRQTEAAEPYRKALEVDPADPAVNKELALFLATSPEPRLRNAPLAVRLATKAVTARPLSADYRNTLGVAHYRNGDDKAAVAELERAMNLRAGGDSFDWFFLAMAHWRLGEREKAQAWFNRAVQWMEKNRPHDEQLRRFRTEAEAMLTPR
jgi:tetratricopeptide (TPR) repeat protein